MDFFKRYDAIIDIPDNTLSTAYDTIPLINTTKPIVKQVYAIETMDIPQGASVAIQGTAIPASMRCTAIAFISAFKDSTGLC